MNTAERRQAILDTLRQAKQVVSASALAERFSVSRQIIVGDVALLRAAGAEISATCRGYICLAPVSSGLVRKIAVQHSADKMPSELYAIIDQGCKVLDVIVEHPVYGQLTGILELSTQQDVASFLKRCNQSDAQPLASLTEGIHLHTLSCPDEEALQRVQQSLRELGILLE